MLTRSALPLALLVLLLALPAAASAQENNSWVDQNPDRAGGATVEVGTSTGGSTGTNTAGGASSTGGCPQAPNGKCTNSAGGWWSNQYGCYLVPAQVPPSLAEVHAGEEAYRCDFGFAAGAGVNVVGIIWLPAGSVGGPDPAVLAQQAVDSMRLQAVAVGLAPPPGSPNPTLVGIPTWMWVDRPTSTTYGPATATASAGGVTVTATAKVSGVTWDMGDGTRVECGKGTPYSPGYGGRPSPDCGHTYRKAGDYTVAATSHWVVDWTGAGRSGRITLDLTGTAGIRVAEAYGLVVGQG